MMLLAVLAVAVLAAAALPEHTDATYTRKVHFTQTFASYPDPGRGVTDREIAMILPPNEGTIYDGSVTFSASGPAELFVLHEILPRDDMGQPTWTVDGGTLYAVSVLGGAGTSGSHEFTGAAVGLRSDAQFAATASMDAWTRGQPTEVIIQRESAAPPEPAWLLSRTSVPATIPMHAGLYGGEDVRYIITDGSDHDHAETLSEEQGWRVEHAPALADVPEEMLHKMFLFKNGIKGAGILGFQEEVFSSTPAGDGYGALVSLVEVTWKPQQRAVPLTDAGEVMEVAGDGRVELDETGIVLNAPQISWPGGQMQVRADPAISDATPHEGGQITELNEENMTATFVAHRGWGPDGRTVYRIITGATPAGPAGAMGVAHSPSSAGLIESPGAVDMFLFKNGIAGSGQLGFQPGVAAAALGYEHYSPMWRIHLVEWADGGSARILETKSDIDAFRADGAVVASLARPTNGDYIINSPLIDPFQ